MAPVDDPSRLCDPASSPLIEACGLSKVYGDVKAVNALSFSIRRGEVVGFLGPNGAGKSTTMKMLTGFIKPTAGIAKVGGLEVAEQPLAVRRLLGYLPENAPLYDDMMVADFLTFIADLRGVPARIQADRLRQTCERCGLLNVLGKDIGQLSKGYRQRVGLAQALVHDPDLLILDEPTSGLDPNQIIEIRELIRDLGRDKTVMLSTHILSEVHATCDRVLIINEGQLVADGRPESLANEATQQAAGRTLQLSFRPAAGDTRAAETWGAQLAAVEGVLQAEPAAAEESDSFSFVLRTVVEPDVRPALFAFAVQEQVALLGLHQQQATLEDTFRRLTRQPSAGARGKSGSSAATFSGAPHA